MEVKRAAQMQQGLTPTKNNPNAVDGVEGGRYRREKARPQSGGSDGDRSIQQHYMPIPTINTDNTMGLEQVDKYIRDYLSQVLALAVHGELQDNLIVGCFIVYTL